eukprot:scaffold155701_cov23-Tisochrysis_lutea.AAC.1
MSLEEQRPKAFHRASLTSEIKSAVSDPRPISRTVWLNISFGCQIPSTLISLHTNVELAPPVPLHHDHYQQAMTSLDTPRLEGLSMGQA